MSPQGWVTMPGIGGSLWSGMGGSVCSGIVGHYGPECPMYNLRRSMSIFGFSELIRLLRAILEKIIAILDTRGVIGAYNAAIIFKYRMIRGVWCEMII